MQRSWRSNIPTEDSEIYRLAGFGGSVGYGKSPALLVIDVQYRTTGNSDKPIRLSIQSDYPTSCGDRAWATIPSIANVINSCRSQNVPIFFPHVAPKKQVDAGRFGQINPHVTSIDDKGYNFVEEVSPEEGDILLPKRHASAFFGTALTSYLIDLKVDTLILVGCTTSGCIRATAVDAFSYNFAVVIPDECVYDRTQTSHDASLFDLDSKYADVLPLSEVTGYIECL